MSAKPQKIRRTIVPRVEDVVIRWKTRGSFIVKRQSFQRCKDDEDICSLTKAKSLALAGLVEILGTESKVMDERTIGTDAIIDF